MTSRSIARAAPAPSEGKCGTCGGARKVLNVSRRPGDRAPSVIPCPSCAPAKQAEAGERMRCGTCGMSADDTDCCTRSARAQGFREGVEAAARVAWDARQKQIDDMDPNGIGNEIQEHGACLARGIFKRIKALAPTTKEQGR